MSQILAGWLGFVLFQTLVWAEPLRLKICSTENPDPGFGLAQIRDKAWPNGSTLRVRFIGGTPTLRARVAAVAATWSEVANIRFDFGEHYPSDIRISFNPGGSNSAIGTDAKGWSQDDPTMNYGWLDDSTPDEELRRVVLHEFGHALGFIHEHQNPNARIPWDAEAVYRYYAATQNPPWDRDKVNHNIFRTYGADTTNSSQFDRQSIMLYAVPNELTVGDYEVGWNTDLSPGDRRFAAEWYPRMSAPPPVASPLLRQVGPDIDVPEKDGRPSQIAIAVSGEWIYWLSADHRFRRGKINADGKLKAVGGDLDGPKVDGQVSQKAIAVSGDVIFWLTPDNRFMRGYIGNDGRLHHSGPDLDGPRRDGQVSQTRIAVSGDTIYWVSPDKIFRRGYIGNDGLLHHSGVPLDGPNPEGRVNQHQIAVDGEWIYWVDAYARFRRGKMDANGILIPEPVDIDGPHRDRKISQQIIAADGGMVYWVTPEGYFKRGVVR